MKVLKLLITGTTFFCSAAETRVQLPSKIPTWPKGPRQSLCKKRPVNLAEKLHEGTCTGNEALMLRVLALGPSDSIIANMMYKGQTPLHVVTSITCARLLLRKEGNPHALNKKGKTPLWQQVINYVMLYDKRSKETRATLIDQRYQQGEIITLLARRYDPEKKERILGSWNRLVTHYKRGDRLKFLSVLPNLEAYSTMMRKLLLLKKL